MSDELELGTKDEQGAPDGGALFSRMALRIRSLQQQVEELQRPELHGPWTHRLITSGFLRDVMARELWAARQGIKGDYQDPYWKGVRFGIESGVWAVQQSIR